ncbi:MAG TPA: baseplate J/gp47 family protein [Cyclobacteriaceae bacterium]|nr:baseplate J/gp47 family protein [Cyclobacteriaceae bacterium]
MPSHVQVDERDHADLILFAKNYAKQLKYFNSSNVADGDWQVFMSMDVSVTLASLVKLDAESCYAYVKKIFDSIKTLDTTQVADLQNHFKVLFDFCFTVTNFLNEYYKALPVDFDFKEVLGNALQSNLPQYYDRLKKYYDEAVLQSIVDETNTFSVLPSPVEIIFSQDFDAAKLDEVWTDSSIPVFTPTFNGGTVALKIKNTCTHNLFTGILDNYLKTLASIVQISASYLESTLESFPKHSPHYGLYLSFIKLFTFSQDHLNEFTKRHLDLYYKEILQLTNKKAEPDQVHLTFELAKTVKDNYLVEKDTAFKAGKDIDGLEMFYSQLEDVVFNKGVVRSLKTVFVNRDMNKNTRQLLASPVANSDDGLGGKLTSADKSWKTFGDKDRPPATVGFVIASHYLYLLEGTRTITFAFYAPAGEPIEFSESHVRDRFSIQLSGEKGWIDVPVNPTDVSIHPSKEHFSITVTLDGGEPAVVPYSQDLHQNNFETTLPVARFTVNSAKANDDVWDFAFEKVRIAVEVIGMKDVAIQNDAGSLDPSKPFELLGSTPHAGSSFVMGSKEIFMKTLQPSGNVNLKVHLTWDNLDELRDLADTSKSYTVDIFYLEDATWKSAHTNVALFDLIKSIAVLEASSSFNQELSKIQQTVATSEADAPTVNKASFLESTISELSFNESKLEGIVGKADSIEKYIQNVFTGSNTFSIVLPPLDVSTDFTENENYSVQSTWGFLKLELNKPDFGHSTYASRLADAARSAEITTTTSGNKSTTTVDMVEVEAPYTPKVKEISIDYKVETLLDFGSDEEGKFIHITPFGSKDISLNAIKKLLPAIDNEGELFIGIENLKTDQTLSVLFQVAEGSADPLAVKQEMFWYFLGQDNEWISFEKENIVDNTNDLTQSGIIRFSIPDVASSENTLMTEKLHWLRGVVNEKSNAVCKIIDVVAQAAEAQFIDYKHIENYFKATLPGGAISKMVVADASIKKISQPYASFGGRVKESDDHFYVRVSERLRHKSRAVTMWDYERIVLEAYPSIYKVKCINHTQVLEKTSGTQTVYIDNEQKPGYVLVVPIPDLQNMNAFDPLRPYTSLGLMTEIKQYLYTYVSPHVNLDVRNPRFEEIQLEFKVKYLTEDNDFYTKQLKEELEQFMAPWAFDPETDIEFGGKISKSVLINFIEERSYVDFISCVNMYQIVEGRKSENVEEALATSSRSVFVSVKSDDALNAHRISFITDKCEC